MEQAGGLYIINEFSKDFKLYKKALFPTLAC